LVWLNIFHIKEIWNMVLTRWLEHFICWIVLKETNINCFHKNSVCWQHSEYNSFIFWVHFSSIKIIHPWTRGKYSSTSTKILSYVDKEYFPNIMSTWTKYSKKDSTLLMCSCSKASWLASLCIMRRGTFGYPPNCLNIISHYDVLTCPRFKLTNL
jgi:hypothetical protein